MFNLIKTVVLLFLVSASLVLSQNYWSNETALNFTIQSNTNIASFVDANGIHIVYYRNGGIKYALVNSQGSVVKYDKVIESEGNGADFVNITVASGNLYAVYYKNNDIKVAKSTNLGDSWNNTFSYFDLLNTGCSKVVAYSDGSTIHITWCELRINQPNDKDVHYVNLNPSSLPLPTWQYYKRVTDAEPQYYFGGSNPDLAFNSERVFVNYMAANYSPVNRDRNSNLSWNNPEVIPFNQFPYSNIVSDAKPMIIGTQLSTVYKSAWTGWTASGVLISHSYKNLNSSTWTQNQSYLVTDNITFGTPYPHVVTNTNDGKIHLIYWDKNQSLYSYRTLTNNSFSSHLANISLGSVSNFMVSNSDDLFLLRTINNSTPGNIYFRHYDVAPLAPVNPQLSANPGNGFIRFSWTKNNEADINVYEVYRKVAELGGTWQYITSTTNNYFVDPTYYYAPGGGDFYITYKVRAKDVGNHLSAFSSEVSTRGEEIGKESVAGNTVGKYSLSQNFPNPFNPNTKISYSLKEEGLVILKVYDVLGKEITTLVNENQPKGNYEVEFDGKEIPSGIYFITMNSGTFSETRKMILMK